MSVILNEVKNLVESMGWKTEILRLMPQNDIATQSLKGRGEGWGGGALCDMRLRLVVDKSGFRGNYFLYKLRF